MAAVLGTNMASVWASKNLQASQNSMASSVERLSSGLRINRAKDDAAGLAVSNALTQQINGAKQGIRNLNDGVSLVQTADGALSTVTEMAQRILTLATQASSGVNTIAQTTAIKNECTALLEGITSVKTRTAVNSTTLFAGTAQSIKSSNVTSDAVSISTTALANFSTSTEYTTLNNAVTGLAASTNGQALIDAASGYITAIDTQRSELGAIQNKMEYAISNVTQLSANLTAARSNILDTDYATETATLTKGQILQQASTAMLAQANQMPNVILSLLK
jgi:flagellin